MMIPIYNERGSTKPKLPKTLSWAIGAQRLSERFAELPQRDNLSIWYADHPMSHLRWPMAKMKAEQIIARGLTYQVFAVWYSIIGTPHWFFMIYPVQSLRKKAIQELLETTAFPEVETWLRVPRDETWLIQSHHLRCLYNQSERRIEMKEENC